MDEDIGESGELLLILQQLGQIVSDGLCVVIVDVAHPHSTLSSQVLNKSQSFFSLSGDYDNDADADVTDVCLCLTQS